MGTNGTLPSYFEYVDNIVSYSSMIFVTLTIPLYIAVLFILILLRKHVYQGMFYRIFMVGGIVDVIAIINNYLGAIFPAKSWFIGFYLAQGTLIGHIYLTIAWSTRCIQGITVTLLALNRATAVCSPIQHKRIWNSPWANLAFVVQLGLGILIGGMLINQPLYWKRQANGYYIQFEDMEFRAFYFMVAYALNTGMFLITISTNIVMMWTFRQKYRMGSTSISIQIPASQKVTTEKQRQENNLILVAFVTCLAEIIYYCYIVYAFAINRHMNTQVFYLFYNMLNDLYGGVGPWLMLALSKSLRMHLRNLVRCGPSKPSKCARLAPSSISAITVKPIVRNKLILAARH